MRAISKLLIPAILGSFALFGQAPAEKAPAKPGPRVATSYKKLQYPPLNKIQVPKPVRVELGNGMIVYLVEDHELPKIGVSVMIRAGDRWEPVEKAGLASITGSVMRTGGTPTRKGDDLDKELDALGASVETGIGEDSGGASISVLKEDIDKGLDILSDILQHPAFPEDKLELEKIQEREGIARRNDNPHGIAAREFQRVILGKDTPYGHITEYATIGAITRDDLVAFHQRFFQPENVILGAWGDFNADEMKAKIEKAFGGWPRGGKPKPPVPEVGDAAANRAGVYFINKDDVSQSTIYMGYLGGKRDDPDYCALEVMDEILGGGFSSRLFKDVRTDQGLAYSVGSQWAAGWDRPGMFMASGATKSQTTVKMVNAIKTDIVKMVEGGATEDELSRAKDSILKGAAFDYDSTGKIVGRLMSYEYYGYPNDFLQRFQDGVRKVTLQDVARVAKQYLKTDRLAILVLGNSKDFDQPLSTLGTVNTLDITIPQPKQKALAAASPESADKGKALLAGARAAMGGDAILKVKDFSQKGEGVLHMGDNAMNIKFDAVVSLSGKMLQKMQAPMGEMTIAYDGQNGWMRMGPNTRDIPASQKAETEANFFRETLSLLQKYDGYQVQALGPSEIAGQKLEGVAITNPAQNQQVTVYVDPASKLIVAKRFTAAMMGPPAETDEIYSDYRDVSGVKIPFKVVTNQDGKPRTEMTLTEAKINPGVEDSAFKKP